MKLYSVGIKEHNTFFTTYYLVECHRELLTLLDFAVNNESNDPDITIHSVMEVPGFQGNGKLVFTIDVRDPIKTSIPQSRPRQENIKTVTFLCSRYCELGDFLENNRWVSFRQSGVVSNYS